MTSRILAIAVGAFYALNGGWAFLFPTGFYSIVATFSPYNLHLIHDAGAFQVGLGVVLVAAAIAGRGLVPALIGVLTGSFLHLVAHLVDIHLGGHPGTDLPALTLIAAALALALVLDLRRPPQKSRS